MASETTNATIRMDKELKKAADELFRSLGMNMTTAVNVFLRQSVRQGKIPFEVSLNSDSENTSENEGAKK